MVAVIIKWKYPENNAEKKRGDTFEQIIQMRHYSGSEHEVYMPADKA